MKKNMKRLHLTVEDDHGNLIYYMDFDYDEKEKKLFFLPSRNAIKAAIKEHFKEPKHPLNVGGPHPSVFR